MSVKREKRDVYGVGIFIVGGRGLNDCFVKFYYDFGYEGVFETVVSIVGKVSFILRVIWIFVNWVFFVYYVIIYILLFFY